MYEPSWARLEFPFIRAWRARGEAFELCKSDGDGVHDDCLDNDASIHSKKNILERTLNGKTSNLNTDLIGGARIEAEMQSHGSKVMVIYIL